MSLAVAQSKHTNLRKEAKLERNLTQPDIDLDTKESLLMKSLSEYFDNTAYLEQMKNIIDQNSVISLRILDWFITNFSKKYRTLINVDDTFIDVYQNYKLQLKSFSKSSFDPFCRKNKMLFYYKPDAFIETSCGQLCFFRWCFENNILDYVKNNLSAIEQDMKNSLKEKKKSEEKNTTETLSQGLGQKRQPLSISAARSINKQKIKYTVKFD